MALQYWDYATQPTPQARLQRARQHLAEIEQLLGMPDTSGDGKSVSRTTLEAKANRLSTVIIPTLEKQAGDVGAPMVVAAVLREQSGASW